MKKSIIILTLPILSLLLGSCGNKSSQETSQTSEVSTEQSANGPAIAEQKAIARMISQEEFKKLSSEKQLSIIDVRTPEEYNSGNIHNSININSADPQLKEKIAALDKSATYVMYCVSGARSGRVMNMMSEMGFLEVYNLEGGYPSYSATNN